MVLPVLAGQALRMLGNDAIKQVVRDKAATAGGRTVAKRELLEEAKKDSGALADQMARSAAEKSADRMGLKGATRTAAVNKAGTEARKYAEKVTERTLLERNTGDLRRAGLNHHEARALAAGDTAKLKGSQLDRAKRAAEREASEFRTGRRFGGNKAVVEIADKQALYTKTDELIKQGYKPAEAARMALTDSVRFKTHGSWIAGQDAVDALQMVKAHKQKMDMMVNLTTKPEQTIKRLMSSQFTRVLDDKDEAHYFDDAGTEWTPEDVEEMAKARLFTPMLKGMNVPKDSFLPKVETMLRDPVERAISTHSANQRSFRTSLINSGVRDNLPRVYNDIMARVTALGPSALANVLKSADPNDIIQWFSSNRFGVTSSFRPLMRALGMNYDDYTEAELRF